MLNTIVKASSVTNLTDARYFAAWQVEWLGFDLSPNGLATLSLQEVKEIKDWIAGPKIVGELAILEINQAQEIIDFLSLEYLQVDMHAPIETLNSLQVSAIIKEVIIEPSTTFESLKAHLDLYFDYVDYFLIDFNKNGIDWEELANNTAFNALHLQQICQQYPIFLSINFTQSTTQKIVDTLNPAGISIKGGMEEKIGLKSFEELEEIFEVLAEEID